MFSSLLGISLVVGLLYWVMTTTHANGEVFGFYNQTALVLLAVGPIAVVFISRSVIDVLLAIKTVFAMSFSSPMREMGKIANTLTTISADVRQRGMGALAQHRNSIKNPLFRDGIVLILNSFTVEEIKHNLTAKINTEQAQLAQTGSVFESLGKLAPAMGLVGTLVGLVQMLREMDDPKKIGPGMAVSLLATLYGVIAGNAIYLPLADKVENFAEKRVQLNTMILEGVLLLKERKSGAYLRDVVNTYTHAPGNKDSQAAQGGGNETPPPQKQAG